MDQEEFEYFYQIFRGMPFLIKSLLELYFKSDFNKYSLALCFFIILYPISFILNIISFFINPSDFYFKDLNPFYSFSELVREIDKNL